MFRWVSKGLLVPGVCRGTLKWESQTPSWCVCKRVFGGYPFQLARKGRVREKNARPSHDQRPGRWKSRDKKYRRHGGSLSRPFQ